MNYPLSAKYDTPELMAKIMGPNPLKLEEELLTGHRIPAGATVSLSTAMGKDRKGKTSEQITLTFPAAEPSATSRIHRYEVRAFANRDGKEIPVLTNKYFAQGFFLPPSQDPVTDNCVIAVSALPTNAVIRFSISPVECFGKKGKAIFSEPWRRPDPPPAE